MAAAADYGQIRLFEGWPKMMIAEVVVGSTCVQGENGVDGRREGLVRGRVGCDGIKKVEG